MGANTNVTVTSVTATDSEHEVAPQLQERNGRPPRRRKKKSVTIGEANRRSRDGNSSSPTKEVRSRIDTGLNSKETVESARRKIKFNSKPQKLEISERPEWK